MGLQGPLTAQALGRSPYDEYETPQQSGEPTPETGQQYDERGRPINPETRELNRDFVKAHNEVMTVIGVAEHEQPDTNSQTPTLTRHENFEEHVGRVFGRFATTRCVSAIGIFGLDGLRQRLMVYRRFSEVPFSRLYREAITDHSISRHVLAGVPSTVLSNCIQHCQLWSISYRPAWQWVWGDRTGTYSKVVNTLWSWVHLHLDLHAALQTLGLIPSTHWLPLPPFFVPFTRSSPIQDPGLPRSFAAQDLMSWAGKYIVSLAPFVIFVMTRQITREWYIQIWQEVLTSLPGMYDQPITLPPPPQRVRNTFDAPDEADEAEHPEEEPAPPETPATDPVAERLDDNGFASDDENEAEGLSATLISFDVEATESSDAPIGLWAAELRPSQAHDNGTSHPVYRDTFVRRLPLLMGSHILTAAVIRIAMAPYHATALRLIARTFCAQNDMSCAGTLNVGLFSGFNLTYVVNFLGGELLWFTAAGDMWALVTALCQRFQLTEEEFKQSEDDGLVVWSEQKKSFSVDWLRMLFRRPVGTEV